MYAHFDSLSNIEILRYAKCDAKLAPEVIIYPFLSADRYEPA